MTLFIFGLVLFLAVHCVRIAAPSFREGRIAAIGDGPWKGVYSVISLAGFALIIWGWGSARDVAGLAYIPITSAKLITHLAMMIALVLIIASQVPSGYIKRVVGHPMMVGVLIWSASHLLVNGDWASVLLFGSFLVWSVVGLVSMYRRPAGEAVAPRLLFDVVSVVVGLCTYVAFVSVVHLYLFGVSPL